MTYLSAPPMLRTIAACVSLVTSVACSTTPPVDAEVLVPEAGATDATFDSAGIDASVRSDSSPPKVRRAFVTSRRLSRSAALWAGAADPFAGADKTCDAFAKEGGLGGTWSAWLSGRDTNGNVINARDRVAKSDYTNVKGILLIRYANSAFERETGVTFADERGEQALSSEAYQWTGSLEDGTLDDGHTCSNWASNIGGATVGWSDRAAWSGPPKKSESWDWMTCGESGSARLYCFER